MWYPREFMHNNVRMRLVDVHPETGIAFYVNNGEGGVIGIRVYPDGRKAVVNASVTTRANSKRVYDAKRKQRYLQFKDAFGTHKGILASHAVYRAWTGKEIPAGMTIDHINGCTTDNRVSNLRCVSNALNMRDGGFLRMLRHRGINPTTIDRSLLLRYYYRMSIIKPNISQRRYAGLAREDLFHVLYDEQFSIFHFQFSNRKRHAKRS